MMCPHNKQIIKMILCFGDKFELSERIGSGSFGEIFFTRNVKTGEDLATKLEKIKNKKASSQLRREAKIYLMLNGTVGVPSVKWFGEMSDKYLLVMELLGQSLEDLFNYCERTFTLKTILLLAYELVSRIESVHTVGKLLHRDIKPENFLIGRGRDRHTVYIIDFGLAKHYCNPATGRHIPMKEGNSLTGTARYASINAHLGLEQSRRDDLFSIGYVLMYFLRGGSLPWQGLKTRAQLAEEAKLQVPTLNLNTAGVNNVNGGVTASGKVVPPVLTVPGTRDAEINLNLQQLNLDSARALDSNATPLIGRAAQPVETKNVEVQVEVAPKAAPQEREDQEKYRLILEKKKGTSLDELCEGHPEEFRKYFDHLLTLSFADTPDYAYLKALFRDLFRKHRFEYDSVLYDWEVLSSTGVHPAKQKEQTEHAQPQHLSNSNNRNSRRKN